MKYTSSGDIHFMKSQANAFCDYLRHMKHSVPYPNNISKLRKAAIPKIVQADIAKVWGCEPPLVSRIENGQVGITQDKIMALLDAFGWTPSQIYGAGQDEQKKVPVLGEVGAGETVSSIDDLPLFGGLTEYDYANLNCEFVDAPPGGQHRNMIALRVRGDSMEPYLFNGDIVYYNEIIKSNYSDHIGKRVIVKLKDGRAYIKVLRKGTQSGHYRLESFNGKDIEDVELEWCAKVAFTKQA